jgi:hypothetical protein
MGVRGPQVGLRSLATSTSRSSAVPTRLWQMLPAAPRTTPRRPFKPRYHLSAYQLFPSAASIPGYSVSMTQNSLPHGPGSQVRVLSPRDSVITGVNTGRPSWPGIDPDGSQASIVPPCRISETRTTPAGARLQATADAACVTGVRKEWRPRRARSIIVSRRGGEVRHVTMTMEHNPERVRRREPSHGLVPTGRAAGAGRS